MCSEHRTSLRPLPFLAITTAGFAATIAQILVLRELLVLFYGNEMSSGLIFAFWLLWTALGSGLAGRWSTRFPPRESTLGVLLALLAAMLPLIVLFIRMSRMLWSISAGELPTIGKMLMISATTTGLFCPLSGALFGVCWAFHRQLHQNHKPIQPLVIYLGESLGAAAGGLTFYYIFLPYFPAYIVVLITSGLILIISSWILRPWHLFSEKYFAGLIWLGVSLVILLSSVWGSTFEKASHLWQWGQNIVAVNETPYHNIAIVKKNEQVSVFANGLWLFSVPDPLTTEHSVHLALLQHPRPRKILLLGGGIAGHLEEIFKYSEIQRIDYVEHDPELIPFTEGYLSLEARKSLHHSRVHLFHEDANAFIRRSSMTYDVIMMNIGDPINAQMNRFYTKEFFDQVKQRLMPGGVFTFAISGGEDMLGHAQARFISSIQKTLLQVFPNILIYPSNHARFFATDDTGKLISDYRTLSKRIAVRKLKLVYIREDALRDALNPFRLGYFKSILDEFKEVTVNRDFSPICYFHNLMLWSTQWHPLLEKFFIMLTTIGPVPFWTGLAVSCALLIIFFWTGPLRFKSAVAGSVIVAGAVWMALQVVFLLTFQILEGFVYLQLALIIAFFMAGLGIGAGWVSSRERHYQLKLPAVSHFIRIQTINSLFPLLLMLLFYLIHGEFRDLLSSTAVGWIFTGLSLTAGILGGVHFALAVSAYALSNVPSEKIGGRLYAMDLTGAAGGVFLATFYILPVYGLMHTLLLMSMVSFICLLTLLRHP
jgi:spermidine synthase